MHIVDRPTSTGKRLTIAVENEAIVARVDGVVVQAVGSSQGLVRPATELRGDIAKAIREVGKTHLLQGNVVIDADEAAAIEQAKVELILAVRDRLEYAVPGLTLYEIAVRDWLDAKDAFDKASEHGYSERHAQALRAAQASVETVHEAYPCTVAFAQITAFCMSTNDAKAAAGRRARRILEDGGDALAAASEMQREWSVQTAQSID